MAEFSLGHRRKCIVICKQEQNYIEKQTQFWCSYLTFLRADNLFGLDRFHVKSPVLC